MVRINTYDEMLKLLIAYDRKLMTQQEFEQKKRELLAEEKRNQIETMETSTILRAQAQADLIREQRSLQMKRYAVLFVMMILLGSAVGLGYARWHEQQAGQPVFEQPNNNPSVSKLPTFGFTVEKLYKISFSELQKEYAPLEQLEEEHLNFDPEQPTVLSVYRATREEGRLTYTFYFKEDVLVRVKVVSGQRWLFEGDLETAKRYGITLDQTAREITIDEKTRVYQRVSPSIEEMAFYLLGEDSGYGAAVFTFDQKVFGAYTTENPEIFWKSAQEVVKSALSRPETAIFPEQERDYTVMDYLGKIWITSKVEYKNAKGEQSSSTFVVRFLPDNSEEANYLEMDGEVLYDWS